MVDLYCNCGLVSLVKSVQKNGSNYGRLFYTCSREGTVRCPFFWWVEPDLHYIDQEAGLANLKEPSARVIDSIKMEEVTNSFYLQLFYFYNPRSLLTTRILVMHLTK